MKKLATAAAVSAFGSGKHVCFRACDKIPKVPRDIVFLTRGCVRKPAGAPRGFTPSRVKGNTLLRWQQRQRGSKRWKWLLIYVANIILVTGNNWQQCQQIGGRHA